MKSWQEIQNARPHQIVDWAAAQPWAKQMAACNQDATWHAEGDVWTHTKMVIDQLLCLPELADLPADDRLKLLFAALFHDSGKPLTTHVDPETGRTHSPKHAQRGVEIGRAALCALACPLVTREEILALVKYHGRPPFLLEKPEPEHEIIRLSWLVNHKLLYLFALADARGRMAGQSSRSEDALHLWKLAAEELACFEKPYGFANDSARFKFYRHELSSLHYAPREEFSCTVTMMSGLPGAGKDTWLARNRPHLPVVSLDALRLELDTEPTDDQSQVIHAAREACRAHLRAGRDFAFNATNTMALTRKRWIELFADYAARIQIVYIEPPLDVLLAQNKSRERPVPTSAIERLIDRREPPTITEAHELLMV